MNICPGTPKIRNTGSTKRMERPLVHPIEEKPDYLDCQSLQRSLKRMKVTTASPGELRLQRDLKHAVSVQGWCMIGPHSWKLHTSNEPPQCLLLQQSREDPLQLNLFWEDWTVRIDVPRFYPHRPPSFQCYHPRHSNPPPRVVLQACPEDPDVIIAARRGFLVIQGWSPLLRLDETIQLVLPAIQDFVIDCEGGEEHDDRNDDDDLLVQMMSDSISHWNDSSVVYSMPNDNNHEAPKEDSIHKKGNRAIIHHNPEFLFPPNRFDVGYGRPPHSDLCTMMQE